MEDDTQNEIISLYTKNINFFNDTICSKEKEDKEGLKEKKIMYNKTSNLYYKIDEQKMKDLRNTFITSKLKVYLKNPIILENGNICSILEHKIKIYENKYFNLLYEIKIENKVEDIIQLENKDIIILIENNIILIYRLKDKNYYLLQNISDDKKGYSLQFNYEAHSAKAKNYKIKKIIGLSGNRFMIISNYGFKIYSLNETDLYSLILLETHLDGIKYIYEIDEKNLLFCTVKYFPSYMDDFPYTLFMIEKISLNDITKEQIDKKIKNKKKEIKEILEPLKFTYNAKKFYELNKNKINLMCSDFIVLKKKYFIIIYYSELLIFDLMKEKKIKKYTILEDEKKKIYQDINIQTWDKGNDNEFIIIRKKNIYLFKFNESIQNGKNEIELKIIGYSKFPNDYNLVKINDGCNRFYRKEKDYILLY